MKRVSYPFMYQSLLPFVFRKLKISLEFFIYVYGAILLIYFETVTIGDDRVIP